VVDFPEFGTLTFLYKVVSGNAGVGAAVLRASLDTTIAVVDTPTVADLLGVWQVGFLDTIPAGSHRITLAHLPGTDLASYVLIGPVRVEFGNNIPAHDHPGDGVDSTRLGPDSSADHTGATVVGSGATSLGERATAYGFEAVAGLAAVAVGASALATDDAVAVGSGAGSEHASGWVAVGEGASIGADGTAAVAIGPQATANGASGVAVGATARATGTESLAIGPGASAAGLRAVALGQGARAPFDYSVAIGAGGGTHAGRARGPDRRRPTPRWSCRARSGWSAGTPRSAGRTPRSASSARWAPPARRCPAHEEATWCCAIC
jgi:hypothetical protein